MFTSSRRVLSLTVVILGLIGGVAVGQVSEPNGRVTDARGETFDVVLPITVDTIPTSTSTTTTTTTSTTTTTVPTTTTTTVPTTTTTTAPVIPETIASPDIVDTCSGSCVDTEGYEINLLAEGVTSGSGGIPLWDAPYLWPANYTDKNGNSHSSDGLPYQPGYGWTEGDRISYCAAYGHLRNSAPIVGGFAAFSANYESLDTTLGFINDDAMPEGYFYVDGTSTPSGTSQAYSSGWCRTFASEFGTDLPYQPSTVSERPRIAFWHDGEVVEIRDYRSTDAAAGVTFELVHFTDEPFTMVDGSGHTVQVTSMATVLGRYNGEPAIAFYYWGVGEGTVTADIP